MEAPKKQNTDKLHDSVEEPVTGYKSKLENIFDVDMPELLGKLIEKGLAQIERGETTSHDEVMAQMKQKYNLPL
jgi:hypothetical protein